MISSYPFDLLILSQYFQKINKFFTIADMFLEFFCLFLRIHVLYY